MAIGILGVFDKIGRGVKDIFTGAGDGISKVVNTAKGQVPPEMQGQLKILEAELRGELAKAEAQMQEKMAELALQGQKEIHDFALKYEGTAAQVPKWLLVVRSLIRPLITLVYFGILCVFMVMDAATIMRMSRLGEKIADTDLIMVLLPTAFWTILGIILAFWFGGKAVENTVDRLKNKG